MVPTDHFRVTPRGTCLYACTRYYYRCSQNSLSSAVQLHHHHHCIWLRVDTFPCSLISVIGVLSIMSPLLFRWLGATVTVLWWLLGCLHPYVCCSGRSAAIPSTQPSLGRADSQPSWEHTTISSLCCCSPSMHIVTLLLPALQMCPLCIYESVHTRVPLRHGFCAAREAAFSFFSSPPQAACALVPRS